MIGKKMLLSWVGAGLLSVAAIPAVGATAAHRHATKAAAPVVRHHATAVATRHHAMAARHVAVRHVQSTHHAVSHKKLATTSSHKPAVTAVKHTTAIGVRSMHSGHATLTKAPVKASAARKHAAPVIAVKHTAKTAPKHHTLAAAMR